MEAEDNCTNNPICSKQNFHYWADCCAYCVKLYEDKFNLVSDLELKIKELHSISSNAEFEKIQSEIEKYLNELNIMNEKLYQEDYWK